MRFASMKRLLLYCLLVLLPVTEKLSGYLLPLIPNVSGLSCILNILLFLFAAECTMACVPLRRAVVKQIVSVGHGPALALWHPCYTVSVEVILRWRLGWNGRRLV